MLIKYPSNEQMLHHKLPTFLKTPRFTRTPHKLRLSFSALSRSRPASSPLLHIQLRTAVSRGGLTEKSVRLPVPLMRGHSRPSTRSLPELIQTSLLSHAPELTFWKTDTHCNHQKKNVGLFSAGVFQTVCHAYVSFRSLHLGFLSS